MPGIGYELLNEPRPQWYAIQTRSRFEKSVATLLGAKEVEHYLPAFGEMHQWKDRKKLVERPAFPGYVFVRFKDGGAARLDILKIPGAVRILGKGDMIEPVPEHEIQSVRILLQSSGKCLSHPFVREGTRVRVRRGPLKDVEGILVRIKNYNRLVVSIELLSQAVATEVDASDVEPIQTIRPERREIPYM
jgi:transcription antitermination factor NusG